MSQEIFFKILEILAPMPVVCKNAYFKFSAVISS